MLTIAANIEPRERKLGGGEKALPRYAFRYLRRRGLDDFANRVQMSNHVFAENLSQKVSRQVLLGIAQRRIAVMNDMQDYPSFIDKMPRFELAMIADGLHQIIFRVVTKIFL